MIYEEKFKFLNLQKVNRKGKDGVKPTSPYFYILNFLDNENNPVKFYSFDDSKNAELTEDINSKKIKGLQEILIKFDLTFNNNLWNVRFVDYSLTF